MPPQLPKSKRTDGPSSANGGSNARRWPTASRRPVTGCSPSPGCPSANGRVRAPPTRSNGSTRSSNAGSRPRRCCPRPRLRPCCSGRCSPIIRLILDGTVVRVRLDRKATAIVLLVVLGVREDGQKVLLAAKNMGGETSEAWRTVLDDLVQRGLRKPEFLIVDGGAGLERALATLWGDVPTQRCTVHKHRNLLAHAPQRLHEEVSADYNDMIYA